MINSLLEMNIFFIFSQLLLSLGMQERFFNDFASFVLSNVDVMFVIRMMLYAIVVFKILEVVFLQKRRMNDKERINKKFIFAYREVLQSLSENEKEVINSTLTNTVKNINISFFERQSHKNRSELKKVSLQTERNSYYEPL